MSSPLAALDGTHAGPLLAALVQSEPGLADRVAAIAEAILCDLTKQATSGPAARKQADPAAVAAAAAIVPFASVPDVPCLTPRGKHDVEFSESAIILRGKPGSADVAPIVIAVANITGASLVFQSNTAALANPPPRCRRLFPRHSRQVSEGPRRVHARRRHFAARAR